MLQTFKVTKQILAESARLAREHNRKEWISTFSPTEMCAISLALKANKEVYGKYPSMYMGNKTIELNERNGTLTPPEEVIQYVTGFDRTPNEEIEQLPEFEFTLDIPE